MNRRKFLINATLASAGAMVEINANASTIIKTAGSSRLKIGICTDVHLDTVHDAPQRLEAFIGKMQAEKPDFIIQIGDFCSPKPENSVFREIWNRFEGPRYDVIGNHDTDTGFTAQQVVDFWKMPARYHSFNIKGFHFIILDGNEGHLFPARDPKAKYVAYIGDEQLKWLEKDIENTNLPVIIFVHQGLDNISGGVQNGQKVRALLDRLNAKARFPKIKMVFTGHHHQDYHNVINGIHYLQINSMSYQWMGKGYEHVPYTEEINKKYPWTNRTAPYKDPLWAVVEINEKGEFKLTGRKTVFVGKTPEELGLGKFERNGYPDVPYISDKKIKLQL